MRTSRYENGRTAVGTAAIVVVVVVVVAVAAVAGYILSTSGGSSTITGSTTSSTSSSIVTTSSSSHVSTTQSSSSSSSSSSSASSSSTTASTSSIVYGGNSTQQTEVLALMAQEQANYNAKDISSIDKLYTPTSVVNWYGYTNGLTGDEKGVGNIQLLYAASLGETKTIDANFTNIQTALVSPTVVNATTTINMTGDSLVVGKLNATIQVSQEWVQSGTTWTIQKEDWNYVLFNVQYPGEATVFPQWSMSLTGHNPDLASMHVVEWHYAPYVAAAVYAGLIAIVVSAVWIRRRQ